MNTVFTIKKEELAFMEKEIQTVGHTLNFIRISNGAAIGKEFRVKICQIAAQSGLCESVVKDCINSLIIQGTITFLMRSDNSYSSCKILNEITALENTNDLVPVIHGNEAERSSSGHSVVAGGRSNSCMTVHETWDKIKKTGKFMSVRERKSLIC